MTKKKAAQPNPTTKILYGPLSVDRLVSQPGSPWVEPG